MKIIDEDKALELLHRAVDKKGADFVYVSIKPLASAKPHPGCVYVAPDSKDEPSCIVGHVISYVQPDLMPQIKRWEWDEGNPDWREVNDNRARQTLDDPNPGNTGIRQLNDVLRSSEGVAFEFTPNALELLMKVQESQDCGYTWGESVDHGIARLADIKV